MVQNKYIVTFYANFVYICPCDSEKITNFFLSYHNHGGIAIQYMEKMTIFVDAN